MAARQSNIELLRIIAMMMVLFLHANGAIGPFVQLSDTHNGVEEFVRLFLEIACVVSVNAFIMISGWFGIKPSVKGICSLFFQLIFYGLIIALVYRISGRAPVSLKETFLSCLGITYWFIPAYVILYILSPFLNSFLDNAPKNTLGVLIVAYFVAQLVYGRFGDQGHFHAGYSALSFVGLYLAAGYLKRYPFRASSLSSGVDFCIYGFLTLATSLLGFFIGGSILTGSHSVLAYNNPLIILSTFFFFLGFSKLRIQSKAINWIASSAFAIYLIHMNHLVKIDYRMLMSDLYHNNSPIIGALMIFVAVILVGAFCVLVDKIRVFTWQQINKIINTRDSK